MIELSLYDVIAIFLVITICTIKILLNRKPEKPLPMIKRKKLFVGYNIMEVRKASEINMRQEWDMIGLLPVYENEELCKKYEDGHMILYPEEIYKNHGHIIGQ